MLGLKFAGKKQPGPQQIGTINTFQDLNDKHKFKTKVLEHVVHLWFNKGIESLEQN